MCSNTCDYCMVLVILSLVCPTLQFFSFNPFKLLNNYAQTPQIQAQPITFKIHKKKLNELTMDPQYSKIPITPSPSGSIRQSSNVLLDPRYSNLPFNYASPGSNYEYTTVPTETDVQNLPDKIMLNGRIHYKTTPLALLLQNKVRELFLSSRVKSIRRIPKGSINHYNKKEKPKKSKIEEKEEEEEEEEEDDESEYEYVYEDDDEDNDEDGDDNVIENYNKDDRKNMKKSESSTKQGQKNRANDAGDNRREKQSANKRRYEDSNGGSGLEENDSENNSNEKD